mgnify:CR=1 FL=1
MATVAELKELALHAVNGTAPANFTNETVDEALRGEMKNWCSSLIEFQRHKLDIFEIIITNKFISQYFLDAIISTEDKYFYKHKGFDFLRIIKAMYVNIASRGYKQGASTITQQYAKNLFLEFDKNSSLSKESPFLTESIKAFIKVDFPAPFSPKRAWISPFLTLRLMLSFALKFPKAFVTLIISIT